MKTAIIYTRSRERNRDSLQAQKDELLRHCAKHDLNIIAQFEDYTSAKDFSRPEFQNMLSFIQESKVKIDYLLVDRWHRFSRNAPHSLNMIEYLKGLKVEVKATTKAHIDQSFYLNQALIMSTVGNVRRP